MKNKESTSWEPVGKWYQASVGEEGHYYHQQVILPKLLPLLQLEKHSNLLDLACGQGILARSIPHTVSYLGLDLSPTLIKEAKRQDKNKLHEYCVADVTQKLPTTNQFTHAAIILALQNIEEGENAIRNAAAHLVKNGKLAIVLNHPCFRIPRQSSWGIDQGKKIQYRRVDRYYTSMKIPIQAHPSKAEKSANTWSFHHPLSTYTQWLSQSGLHITGLEEWCSNKISTGSSAKMENRSREEFPLFLTIIATKAGTSHP